MNFAPEIGTVRQSPAKCYPIEGTLLRKLYFSKK